MVSPKGESANNQVMVSLIRLNIEEVIYRGIEKWYLIRLITLGSWFDSRSRNNRCINKYYLFILIELVI